MPIAISLRIANQDIDLDGSIRLTYDCFVIDQANNFSGGLAVSLHVPEGITPQQFKSSLTDAIIESAKVIYPEVTLAPGDCLIDVVQRGN